MTEVETLHKSKSTGRVFLYMRPGEDISIIQDLLAQMATEGVVCTDIEDLCRHIVQQDVNAVLLAESALREGELPILAETLQDQPPWSDVPVLFVAGGGLESPLALQAMQELPNVLVLDQSVRIATLAGALRMALRMRDKQWRVRDLLQEFQDREQALHAAEERLHLAMESGKVGVWEWEVGKEEVQWSDGVYTLLGYEPGEVTPSRTVSRERIHPEDCARQDEALKDALEQCEEYVSEFRVVWADGSVHWVEARGQYVYEESENGVVLRMRGVLSDIDRRKRAEEALRQAEERLRHSLELNQAVMSSMGEGLYTLNAQGLVTYVNPAAEELLGWASAELLGRRMHDMIHYQHADGSPFPIEECSGYKVLQTGTPVIGHEDLFIRKDGTFFPVVYSSACVGVKGQITGLVVVFRDITVKKQAEQALRAKDAELELILTETPFMLTRCSRDLHYRYVSRAYAEMLGSTPDQIAGRPILEIMGEEGFEAIRPHVETVLQGQPVEYEAPVFFQGVGSRFLHVAYVPDKDERGQVIGWIASILDITERKQAEEALRRSEEQFHRLFEDDLTGDLISTPEGRILLCNPAFAAMFGFPSPQDAVGTSIVDLYVDPCEREPLVERLRKEGRIERQEVWRKRRDGAPIHIVENLVGHFNEQGELYEIKGYLFEDTARTRAEEALAESEERFRALMTASSEVLYRMSPDWSEMRQLHSRGFLGATEEPSRIWLDKYIPPDDQPQVTAVIQEAIRTKSIFELEHRVWRADGSLGWTFSRAVPLLDTNGAIVEWFGAASDVTERRHAEEALRQSERQFKSTFESAAIGIAHVALDGHILRFNGRFCEIAGYLPDDIIGKTCEQITFADDWKAEKEQLGHLQDDEVDHYSIEKRYIRMDGSPVWVNLTRSIQYDEAGKPEYFIVLVEDISARKRAEEALRQSEERFRKLFEANLAGVYITKLDGTILDFNDAMMRMLGYNTREEVFQHKSTDFFADPEFRKLLLHLLQKDGVVPAKEAVLKRKDGSVLYALGAGVLLVNEQTGEPYIQGVAIDITERKQAEEALRESELRVRRKLESVLSPEGDLGVLELADLIDAPDLQKLMEDFYAVAHVPIGIIDTQGRVLVGVGWQDICTRFHRVHPDTCRHCMESDTQLTADLSQGEYRLYKCKNNLWDMATPIVVAGQLVGNIFTGQFFFEDETVDREAFRVQARQYGFDEAQYLAALDRVPRLSRETVEHGMGFFRKLADMLSQLGYSNVKLARLLAERDRLTESLSQSESFYRQTLESIPGMVFTTRPDGYCDYQSQQWVDYTGVPMWEHLGNGWNELLHPEDRPRAFAAWRDAVEGKAPYELEYRVRRHDGQYEWFRVMGRPIRDEAGQIVRWFGVAVNIEAMKQAEEALHELTATLESKVGERTAELRHRTRQLQKLALEMSEAEDRERERLAHILHDDLQQELAAAKFHLSILRGRIKHESSVQETAVKIDEMLVDAIAKSRSLSHELSPAVLRQGDLTEILRWLANEMRAKHGLTVHVQGQASSPPDAVKAFVYRTAQELLFNAVKHAQVPEARVRVRQCGEHICLSVSDRGRGFDPQRLREAAGFGLLSIRERIELLGGRMKIKSAPGRGSTFFVVVPVGETAGQLSGQAAERGADADRARLRVLLADDHQVVRQGLVALLGEEETIEVVGEAANGREAVDLSEQLHPDVVVMDVSMPVMSGEEATRQIKEHLPQTRIVSLSMREEPEIRDRMCQAGAESYVLKTAPGSELLAAIRGENPTTSGIPCETTV